MVDSGSNQTGSSGHPVPPGVRVSKVQVPIFTLLAWAGIIAVAAVLFFMKQHISEPSNQISQAEFLEKLAANQIASAMVLVDQQKLPLVEISGRYWNADQSGLVTEEDKKEVPFQVHNFMMTSAIENSLAHSPRISFSSPNTVLSNLLWGIAPFMILGVLFWFFFIRQIKNAAKIRQASETKTNIQ